MQLNYSTKSRKKNSTHVKIAERLALATTTLLGASASAQSVDTEWNYSTSLLAYSEPERVSATELIIAADKAFGDSAFANIKVVLDSLTGASANGAIAQTTAQTFTRPSGRGQYQIDANNTPLDDTFKDTRLQVNATWSDALNQTTRYTLGTNLSREYDYRSVGLSGQLAWDFNQKNTTLSAGLSFASDQIIPEGKIPLALSSMVIDQGQFASPDDYWNAFNVTRSGRKQTAKTAELLFGWTQVVSRRWLWQFNYGFADVTGYLTDPFKVLSVVDTDMTSQDYVYENRPDSRSQHSLFTLTKYHFEQSIFDISYRYINDDWQISSHTIDTHWRFISENKSFWEPHLRFYWQSAAKFYTPFLIQDNNLPVYASADYRVGQMQAFTLGFKYGMQLDNSDSVEFRLEYYRQTPQASNQPESVNNSQGLDLYPEVEALILQINYFL